MSVPVIAEGANARQIREALHESAAEIIKLRSLAEDKQTDETKAEIRSQINFINEMDVVEKGLSRSEVTERQESRGPNAAHETAGRQARSFGDRIVMDERYEAFAKSGRSSSGFEEIQVEGSMFSRALVSEGTISQGIGVDAGVWLPTQQPLPPIPRQQRLFVRDLVSVATTQLANIPYIQELNPATNETGATAVAENTLKPEVEMDWVRQDAPVRKIAAWVPVTTEIIEDAPTLRGYIDQRLLYMIALREEQQILNGGGVAPNLAGIRQGNGLQTQTAVSGDLPATVGLAWAKIEMVDGEPDGIAYNPTDYWTALTTRHANRFDNGYGGNAPAIMSAFSWGLPSIRTRSMESGKFLIGNFRLGATLFDREQSNIRVGNQHADFFTNNKVVVLGEERVALALHRPDFFVLGTYA